MSLDIVVPLAILVFLVALVVIGLVAYRIRDRRRAARRAEVMRRHPVVRETVIGIRRIR